MNGLTDFDVMLSGYAPGAAAVNAVGAIAKTLKAAVEGKPGSFFWGECAVYLMSIYVASPVRDTFAALPKREEGIVIDLEHSI